MAIRKALEMGSGGREEREILACKCDKMAGRIFPPLPRSLYQTRNKPMPSTKPAFPDDTFWIAVANFANLPNRRYHFFATDLG